MLCKQLIFLTLLTLFGVGRASGAKDGEGFRIVRRCNDDGDYSGHHGGYGGDHDHKGDHHHKHHDDHDQHHGHKGHKDNHGHGDHDHKGHKGDHHHHHHHHNHSVTTGAPTSKPTGPPTTSTWQPPTSTTAVPPPPPPPVSKYFVDGKHIPGVPFEVPDSYAGLMPITAAVNESRHFFFWWYPNEQKGVGDDDLVIWLNGGPGCSSLEGLLQENGPVLFPFNSKQPVLNPFSWSKLANVLWVEQPVGTGLGKGTQGLSNERQVASQFYTFLVEFMKSFPELKNKKIYITGESYAGRYIPYIADEMLNYHNATENAANGINYYGISINDPTFIDNVLSQEMPAVEFAIHYQKELQLPDSFMDYLKSSAVDNGIDNFVAKNLKYPPTGPIQIPSGYSIYNFDPSGDIHDTAKANNPCFNVYNIDPIYHCPSVYDPLGYAPDAISPDATNVVNNITGFKEYIHADPNTTWYECVNFNIFDNGYDTSLSPANAGIMTKIIEASPSGRTIIQHGLLDFSLMANGSALGIQNLTFGGLQGFQTAPTQELIVNGQQKGLVHTERGLTFFQARGAGHMIPQDQPESAFKMLQYLLGQIGEADLYN